ncbi:MAG TPA: gfo/Idh/MocA family oxidoreductase, partial [Lachnospiraceae bacterium]|nr:gfo/Idh/MocA family oxidoreductase [Lachnospiraceae bacterium]
EVNTDGENPQHVGVLKAFAGKILHGTPLVAEGVEGIHGLMLSNAMHLSSWLKQPVTIPFDEDLFLAELNKLRAASRLKENISEVTFTTEGSYGTQAK